MMLSGIDGGHLLGFMAALGALRLLDDVAVAAGSPRPTLEFDASCTAVVGPALDPQVIVDAIMGGLDARRQYYVGSLAQFDKPSDFTPHEFRELARSASGWRGDVLAGLACSTGDAMVESTLCAANGASHQELIRSIRDVLALVRPQHVSAALFNPWTKSYEVPAELRKSLSLGSRKPTLRLDPADERLYALRATNPTPSASAYRTELGAQALAIPAFELLPVCPMQRPLCIASHAPRRQNRVFYQWCLWQVPATLSAVRSMLAAGPKNAAQARSFGAFAAFEVARVTGDKGKLSMAPTTGLW
jgi:hypothetical protein